MTTIEETEARRRRVAEMMVRGITDKKLIAEKLAVTPGTIDEDMGYVYDDWGAGDAKKLSQKRSKHIAAYNTQKRTLWNEVADIQTHIQDGTVRDGNTDEGKPATRRATPKEIAGMRRHLVACLEQLRRIEREESLIDGTLAQNEAVSVITLPQDFIRRAYKVHLEIEADKSKDTKSKRIIDIEAKEATQPTTTQNNRLPNETEEPPNS